ncbi:hypothetical protein CUJ83_02280 [Methanocella sp. CWC-04]|uniref:Uncharacterized protein n=1 Tax=Methanooceanicella nereidis TaxID=2052831 RepID=A0AAP2RAD5_9EURY|nr:hypothetical protein [Methanocella sp. CWC-04]
MKGVKSPSKFAVLSLFGFLSTAAGVAHFIVTSRTIDIPVYYIAKAYNIQTILYKMKSLKFIKLLLRKTTGYSI